MSVKLLGTGELSYVLDEMVKTLVKFILRA